MSDFDFSSIEPYGNDEVPKALARLAHNPMYARLVKTMNPKIDFDSFMAMMECITTCDELQYMVMRPLIYQIVQRSAASFTYDGLENISKDQPYLFVSNHRAITLDAGLFDVALISNGFKTPEIGFGNNLMKNDFIVDLFRLNKMFTIIRDGSRRDFYNNSVFLSNYIHHVLFEKKSSVWIAQRNGRTKNGDDRTDQGLLKMFSMAGTGDFEADFNSLQIVPVAISYEYEPCDFMKSIAEYTASTGIYEKTAHEDVLSMMMDISQKKGDIHLSICKPITPEEVGECARLVKNERFSALAEIIDKRIHKAYKLHKTNYICTDLLREDAKYVDCYTTAQMEEFIKYAEHSTLKGPSLAARESIMDLFLTIYANPVFNKEKL
ncbi:MAG: 1-acyl-sn-glycerol-3-phosphate acyltransferase [Bacteroidales bacterium]|nr:1-acyl-sn-glycerol-3-phosphate acyltransferase [Bacteroidales bacterium]